MGVTFTAEQKRLINAYFPGLGVIPPNVGEGGLLGVIATAVDAAIAAPQATADSAVAAIGPLTSATAAGTGVTLSSSVVGGVKHVTLTLVDTPIPMVDDPGVVAYGGLKIADLPEGLIFFMGAVMDLALTKSSAGVNAAWDGDIGLGTAAAAAGATLAGTEQDLVPTTPTPQAVSGVTTGDAKSTSTEAGKIFDGTGTAKDVYLNVLVDDTDHDVTATPCNIIVNGTVKLAFMVIGDN